MTEKKTEENTISVYMDVGAMINNEISPRQALILREMLMGEVSYRDIRKKLGFRAMNMWMDVEVMRRNKLLTNEKGGKDRRMAYLKLTEKGKNLIDTMI